jgi:hypothetical protein
MRPVSPRPHTAFSFKDASLDPIEQRSCFQRFSEQALRSYRGCFVTQTLVEQRRDKNYRRHNALFMEPSNKI